MPARGERVILEFVSANPTGPLHVGHGRQAAYGATLGNLLRATGHQRAPRVLHQRCRPADGHPHAQHLAALPASAAAPSLPFPSNGYRGDYVHAIAAQLEQQYGRDACSGRQHRCWPTCRRMRRPGDKEQYIDALIARMRALLGDAGFEQVLELALAAMLADIRDDLAAFGVEFDRWYSERELVRSGAIEHALDALEARGALYRKDGALWFRASQFGDDEDRVLVRANGQQTYFAPDIAYHLQKRERGFARLIDVLGADHHGYVARVRGALVAMGEPGDCLEACLIQFVNLFRGGQKIADGQARGAVRHAAPAARGGRQRCLPAVLSDAQSRSAARFRSRAGQVAQQ